MVLDDRQPHDRGAGRDRFGTLQRPQNLDRRCSCETLHVGERQQGLDALRITIHHGLDPPDRHVGTTLGKIEPGQIDCRRHVGRLPGESLLECGPRGGDIARGQHQAPAQVVHKRVVRLLALEFGLRGKRLVRFAPAQMTHDEGEIRLDGILVHPGGTLELGKGSVGVPAGHACDAESRARACILRAPPLQPVRSNSRRARSPRSR